MGDKQLVVFATISSILIALYFVILLAERVQSLIRANKNHVLLHDGLHKYMFALCMVSIGGSAVILISQIIRTLQFMGSGDVGEALSFTTGSMVLMCGAIGCILLSGMVHTEYSIPGIQFVSYGVLIVAMILRVVMNSGYGPGAKVLVLVYIVAFSMAIPVVYPSEVKHKKAFHIIESIVSAVLVAAFTVMLFQLFMGKYAWVFHPAFLLTAIVGDVMVLALRWKEEVNWFVLVSLAITVVTWIVSAVAYLAG